MRVGRGTSVRRVKSSDRVEVLALRELVHDMTCDATFVSRRARNININIPGQGMQMYPKDAARSLDSLTPCTVLLFPFPFHDTVV